MTTLKHVVGFSGGIDSQACALWVRQRFPAEDVILLNTQAGRNEHPITVSFVQWYSDTIHPVIEVVPIVADMAGKEPGAIRRMKLKPDDELTFDLLAGLKGIFPSSQAQFCTTHLKLEPQRRWMRENLEANGIDYERYVGVRREEGRGTSRLRDRSNIPDSGWDEFFDCPIHYPLAAWTKVQCFEFVAAAGEECNPLYKMGFPRVGCAPCGANPAKEPVRLWAARFPEMIDKVRGWDQKWGRTFFPPCVPGLTINWIDDVVAWSRTSYGGRQVELPILEADAALGACSSKYGLCE